MSFLKKENFFKILLILLTNNNNLVLETLDLLINYLNDPILYKEVVHLMNISHILVFYLIKYRSKSIMKYLDNINYFNNVLFSDKTVIITPDSLGNIVTLDINKFSLDDITYASLYPESNKILFRYFPINFLP